MKSLISLCLIGLGIFFLASEQVIAGVALVAFGVIVFFIGRGTRSRHARGGSASGSGIFFGGDSGSGGDCGGGDGGGC